MDAGSDDALRANTYALLATLLASPPTKGVIEVVNQIDGVVDGERTSVALAWQTLKLAGERAEVSTLDDEYHALFIGIGRGELVPYGSWYLTGSVMDQPLAVLRRDLASLGVERQEGVSEPEDHVAGLCETMSMIINHGEEISFATQRRFFNDHIAPWMEKFFRDLKDADSACFYKAVGQLGEDFIKLEKQYLGMLI